MRKADGDARRQILKSAEKKFAERGFAGTSVQDIIEGTKFTKPTLYYYFKNKEGLYRALMAEANEECSELVRKAAAKQEGIEAKLVAIAGDLFEHMRDRKDQTRLAFAASFSGKKEMPPALQRDTRCSNFDFFHRLIINAQHRGELTKSFSSRELTDGIYGALSFYLMANVLMPGTKLNRQTARRVVELFMEGARAK